MIGQTVSSKVKTLSNANLVASMHNKSVKVPGASLKTPFLKYLHYVWKVRNLTPKTDLSLITPTKSEQI